MPLAIRELPSRRYDAYVNDPDRVNRAPEIVRARTEGITQTQQPTVIFNRSRTTRAIGIHAGVTINPYLDGDLVLGPGRMNNQEPFGHPYLVPLGIAGGYGTGNTQTRPDITENYRPEVHVDIKI